MYRKEVRNSNTTYFISLSRFLNILKLVDFTTLSTKATLKDESIHDNLFKGAIAEPSVLPRDRFMPVISKALDV